MPQPQPQPPPTANATAAASISDNYVPGNLRAIRASTAICWPWANVTSWHVPWLQVLLGCDELGWCELAPVARGDRTFAGTVVMPRNNYCYIRASAAGADGWQQLFRLHVSPQVQHMVELPDPCPLPEPDASHPGMSRCGIAHPGAAAVPGHTPAQAVLASEQQCVHSNSRQLMWCRER